MSTKQPEVKQSVLYPKLSVLAVAQALQFQPPPALVTMRVGGNVVRYKLEANRR